jgi:hypothetical protein
MNYTEDMNCYVIELNEFRKNVNDLNTELLIKKLEELKIEFNSFVNELPNSVMTYIEITNFYKNNNFKYSMYFAQTKVLKDLIKEREEKKEKKRLNYNILEEEQSKKQKIIE